MLRNLLCSETILRNFRLAHITVSKRHAGHSKWANIKHTKGLKDAQRSSLFTKLSRQIKVAVQEGGSPDPKNNLKLEQVIEQTRRANMPSATVQSVIKSCLTDKKQCKSHTLEIKGPGGCLILCEVFTDNIHHLKQTMVTILKKHSSKFSDGGGKHLFEQKGIVLTEIPANTTNILESATDHAIESGAEDVRISDDECLEFICAPSCLKSVLGSLEKLDYKVTSGDIEYIPIKGQVLNESDLQQCGSLYEKLEAVAEVVKLNNNVAEM